MNIGDKITWAYRSLLFLTLIWLRFIEQYITVWGVWVVWAVITLFIFWQPWKKPENQKNGSIGKENLNRQEG